MGLKYICCGFKVKGDDQGEDRVSDSRWCVHVLSSPTGHTGYSWLQIHYRVSHAASAPDIISHAVRCTDVHKGQRAQFRLMLLLFKCPSQGCLVGYLPLIAPSCPCFLHPEDIFILHGKDKKNPLIYGLFTTSRYVSQPKFQKLKWNT